MKKQIRINHIHRTASLVFWKEGPLLFDVAQSKLPCLFNCTHKSIEQPEY